MIYPSYRPLPYTLDVVNTVDLLQLIRGTLGRYCTYICVAARHIEPDNYQFRKWIESMLDGHPTLEDWCDCYHNGIRPENMQAFRQEWIDHLITNLEAEPKRPPLEWRKL